MSNLHGYGKESSTESEGLFENGKLKKEISEIEEYSTDVDLIAKKIEFENFILFNEQVIE